MDFTFTDEQRMSAAALRELLDDCCSASDIRATAQAAPRARSDRWQRLVELGIPGVLAPESVGGLGLAAIDFVLLAEETGRAALPEPMIEHAGVAVPMLAEASSAEHARAWLKSATEGGVRIAVAHPEHPFVLHADTADAVLLASGSDVHLVERQAIQYTHQPGVDSLRKLFSLEWAPSRGTLVADGSAARGIWAAALDRGALFTAAECLGLAARMMDLAVAYAAERRQFGKPIGSYQALKHHMADVMVKLEFARPVVYAAAARVGENSDRSRALVSHAKLAAGDAADIAARKAMQVHGAMGYSWEVDLHFYMKRAWALAGAWGDRSFHVRRVQSLLFSGGIETGPDRTFD